MKSIILLFINLLIFSSLAKGFSYKLIRGKGPIVEQELSLNTFTKVSHEGPFNIIIKQGNTQSILLKGQQNIIDCIEANVQDHELNIGLKNGRYTNYQLTIYITISHLSEVKLKGSGNTDISNFLEDSLTLKINGSGNIHAKNITSQNLFLSINGHGNIDINGTSSHQKININGSGNVLAYGLNENKSTTVMINGSGTCKIKASESIKAIISGSGNVYYKGKPVIQSSITGVGRIKNKN